MIFRADVPGIGRRVTLAFSAVQAKLAEFQVDFGPVEGVYATPETCQDGDVRAGDTSGLLKAGVAFAPEVFFRGSWYRICLHDFGADDHGATVVCRMLGFAQGVRYGHEGESVRGDHACGEMSRETPILEGQSVGVLWEELWGNCGGIVGVF